MSVSVREPSLFAPRPRPRPLPLELPRPLPGNGEEVEGGGVDRESLRSADCDLGLLGSFSGDGLRLDVIDGISSSNFTKLKLNQF